MEPLIDIDSSRPALGSSFTSRAPTGAHDTAQPALASGFGAIIEAELELQQAIAVALGRLGGEHVVEEDRILRHQFVQVGANIALLEQRYQTLLPSDRFTAWEPAELAGAAQSNEPPALYDLIARHERLIESVNALIDCNPDGQRGELTLREIARNHHELARMLTALLSEGETGAPAMESLSSALSLSTE